jgi:hypothetical protein
MKKKLMKQQPEHAAGQVRTQKKNKRIFDKIATR